MMLSMAVLSSAATTTSSTKVKITLDNIPAYSNSPYVEINNNKPSFKSSEKKNKKAFEKYSDLDELGRCGVAYANICKKIMPTEERGSIGMVKPSGWQTVKYMGLVDGNYLYNRCHLIGYQLAGENANEKNLITGTRYLNVEGMLPFENEIADYIDKYPKRHVLYRVTPIFEGENLVASGVQMEAYSVEDKGKGVCFNVYCYNVQPEIVIDYSDGTSKLADNRVIYISLSDTKATLTVGKTLKLKAYTEPEGATTKITWFSSNKKVAKVNSKGIVTALKAGTATITAKTSNGLKAKCKITVNAAPELGQSATADNSSSGTVYVLNTNTHKFHEITCSSVDDIKSTNRQDVAWTREEIISKGYEPCKRCNP
jgi:DNA-entry nuclease